MIAINKKHIPLRSLVVCALLAFSSLGCAAIRAPLTCPKEGGPAWTELRSAHFVLLTDVDMERASARLTELEAMHTALAALIRRGAAEPAGKVEVVFFERAEDFYEVAGQERTKGGYFTTRLAGDIQPQPIMVMPSNFAEETRELFQHELAHRLLHLRFGRLPTWLNEGLAQYYSTLRIEADGVRLGGRLTSIDFSERPFFWESWYEGAYQLQVPASKAPTIQTLLASDGPAFYLTAGTDPSRDDRERQAALYAGAWKLVQFLLNGPGPGDRARFEAVLAAIERGSDARSAFQQSFGDAGLARLEVAFRDYLTEVRLDRLVFQLRPPPPVAPASVHTLSEGELHLLWARLLPWKQGAMARVLHELDDAAREEPSSPEVRFQRAIFFMREERLDEAKAELGAALAARPEDPRYLLAWILHHRVTPSVIAGQRGREIPREVVDRLARVASSATELNEVAWYHAERRHPDEAMPFAERAVRLDPLCWTCLDTYALVLFEKGRLDEAMKASDRAVSVLPEKVSAPGIHLLHRQIEQAVAEERRSRK